MWFRKEKTERPRRLRKRVVVARLVFCLALLAGAGVGLLTWRIHRANIHVWASDLHVWPSPKRGDRILIFAPHCDDETLGLSGLTQQAVAAGAEVHIVWMTNGDGFPYSAEREFGSFSLKHADYIRFGRERQAEALAATTASGMSPRNATFLGYPDSGLAEMWLHNWTPDKPFQSRFTGCSRSPYSDSLTPKAVYCGQQALNDVKSVIRSFKPTYVYCPHPNDNHPDHWATYVFVAAALWELNPPEPGFGHPVPGPVLGVYLVHRGDWPVPQGLHPKDDLPPPAAMVRMDTEWRQIPLTAAQEATKQIAVTKYSSQMRVMKRFLTTFVRRNELVGLRPPGPLTMVQNGQMRIVDRWRDLPVGSHDPINDTVQTDIGGSGDIVSISAAEDSRRLYLRVETRRPISPRVAYDIYWHALPGEAGGTRGISLRLNGPQPKGAAAVAHDNVWQVAVPRPPGNAVMVGAKTRYHRFTLDKSGWRVLEPVGGRTVARRTPR